MFAFKTKEKAMSWANKVRAVTVSVATGAAVLASAGISSAETVTADRQEIGGVTLSVNGSRCSAWIDGDKAVAYCKSIAFRPAVRCSKVNGWYFGHWTDPDSTSYVVCPRGSGYPVEASADSQAEFRAREAR
ncbi:hypothetical protein ACSNOK_04835 [Streptomyces sp. URMC 126]|uniref:hypothetical protein n=1 Tax=Streptomyces sp. URMC 126 TaxID=3423401 RepID=UPI003F1DC422